MGVDPVTGTALMVGSGIGQGLLGARGADKANVKANAGRSDAINEMRSALEYFRELKDPYAQAGKNAINPLVQAINGTDSWRHPLLDQIQAQVSRDVLQNASLTGRYGAGDMPGLLATSMIDPEMQLRQNRIANLSGLVQMGMNTTSELGRAEMGGSEFIGNQRAGIGENNANATIAKYGAMQNGLSTITSAFTGGVGGPGMTGTGGFTNPLATSNPYGMTTPGTSGIPNYLLPRV